MGVIGGTAPPPRHRRLGRQRISALHPLVSRDSRKAPRTGRQRQAIFQWPRRDQKHNVGVADVADVRRAVVGGVADNDRFVANGVTLAAHRIGPGIGSPDFHSGFLNMRIAVDIASLLYE